MSSWFQSTEEKLGGVFSDGGASEVGAPGVLGGFHDLEFRTRCLRDGTQSLDNGLFTSLTFTAATTSGTSLITNGVTLTILYSDATASTTVTYNVGSLLCTLTPAAKTTPPALASRTDASAVDPAAGVSGDTVAPSSPTAGPLATLGTGAAGSERYRSPAGVVVADGRVVVADTANHRVLINDSILSRAPRTALGGAAIAAWAVAGQPGFHTAESSSLPTGLSYPMGLAFWRDRMIVADILNRRVLVYTGFEGSFRGHPGRAAETVVGANERLDLPQGVSAAGNRLFVADGGAARVLVYENLDRLRESDAPAIVMGGFGSPGGVFSSGGADVWVADRATGRVQ